MQYDSDKNQPRNPFSIAETLLVTLASLEGVRVMLDYDARLLANAALSLTLRYQAYCLLDISRNDVGAYCNTPLPRVLTNA